MRFWAEAASVRTITILVVEKTRSKQANSTVLLRIISFLFLFPSVSFKRTERYTGRKGSGTYQAERDGTS